MGEIPYPDEKQSADPFQGTKSQRAATARA